MKSENIYIVHPENLEQENAFKAFAKALKMKFEVANGKSYNPDFVAKIEKSRQDYKEGKGKKISIDELKVLWK